MEKIVWTNDYLIGIPEIDRQHKTFITIINRLIDFNCDDNDADTFAAIIAELSSNLSEHLTYEEQLLEDEGYPDLQRHKHEHATSSEEFTIIMHEALSNKQDVRNKLISLLKAWFKHHLLVDDMAYQQFLIKKGVIETAFANQPIS
jgi:hemerythrin-like metal-binding protein